MEHQLIVVQDADLAILDMIRECLCDEGYNVSALSTYQDVFNHIKLTKPSLAIIELLCTNPRSGMTLLDTMRSDPTTMHIPVIITSSDNKLLHTQGAFLCADNYAILQKPFDIEELFTIMSRMIRVHEPSAGLALECGGSEICY